jgi:hypothetical protein
LAEDDIVGVAIAPVGARLEHHGFRNANLDEFLRRPLPERIKINAVQHFRLIDIVGVS